MYLLHRTQLNLNFSFYQELPSCWWKCRSQGSTSQANKIPTPQQKEELFRTSTVFPFLKWDMVYILKSATQNFQLTRPTKHGDKHTHTYMYIHIYHKIAWTRPIRIQKTFVWRSSNSGSTTLASLSASVVSKRGASSSGGFWKYINTSVIEFHQWECKSGD